MWTIDMLLVLYFNMQVGCVKV